MSAPPWLNKLDGGHRVLQRVVIDDCLGLAAEFEADMARHVASYRCEWKETIEDPERMARFRTFVNSDQADPNVVFITERGQPRPAYAHQKPDRHWPSAVPTMARVAGVGRIR